MCMCQQIQQTNVRRKIKIKKKKKNDDDEYRDGKSEAKVGEEKKRYYNIEKRMKQNIYKYQKCNITFTNV